MNDKITIDYFDFISAVQKVIDFCNEGRSISHPSMEVALKAFAAAIAVELFNKEHSPIKEDPLTVDERLQ